MDQITNGHEPSATAAPETFRETAGRILGQQGERLARLRPVFDAIGDIPVAQLRTADIARAHAAAVEQRLVDLRNDLGAVLCEADIPGEALVEAVDLINLLNEAAINTLQQSAAELLPRDGEA